MLPPESKIFYGRESELADILQLFRSESPRIAILGAGGMGKTSLANTVLHHTDIAAKYRQHRFWVACDSTATPIEFASLIGAHIGLSPGRNLTQLLVQHFRRSPPCLLVLDNLETVWEPLASREPIEEFLALLTDIGDLALMVCT
jgi:Cdc6-like AAA superfamily ATPase